MKANGKSQCKSRLLPCATLCMMLITIYNKLNSLPTSSPKMAQTCSLFPWNMNQHTLYLHPIFYNWRNILQPSDEMNTIFSFFITMHSFHGVSNCYHLFPAVFICSHPSPIQQDVNITYILFKTVLNPSQTLVQTCSISNLKKNWRHIFKQNSNQQDLQPSSFKEGHIHSQVDIFKLISSKKN